jgi:hypothetical protein
MHLVCAYWLEPVDGIGMSVVVFATEAFARAAVAYPVPPMEGVTLLNVTVREVFAHVDGAASRPGRKPVSSNR